MNIVVVILEIMGICEFVDAVFVEFLHDVLLERCIEWLFGLHGKLETPNSELIDWLMI